MGLLIDETKNRHGRLLVIERVGSRGHEALWWCRCDCGRETLAKGYALRRGDTQSCGCYQRECASNLGKIGHFNRFKLPDGEASFNRLYGSYAHQAKLRNKEWGLTKDQFRNLTQQACRYCGRQPNQSHGGGKHNGAYVFNGIDRVDSTLGYLPNNCVACCKRCNYAKNDMTLGEFVVWVEQVHSIIANMAAWEQAQ